MGYCTCREARNDIQRAPGLVTKPGPLNGLTTYSSVSGSFTGLSFSSLLFCFICLRVVWYSSPVTMQQYRYLFPPSGALRRHCSRCGDVWNGHYALCDPYNFSVLFSLMFFLGYLHSEITSCYGTFSGLPLALFLILTHHSL